MQYSDTSPYKVSENATLINATLADLNVVNDKSINATRDLFSNQFYANLCRSLIRPSEAIFASKKTSL